MSSSENVLFLSEENSPTPSMTAFSSSCSWDTLSTVDTPESGINNMSFGSFKCEDDPFSASTFSLSYGKRISDHNSTKQPNIGSNVLSTFHDTSLFPMSNKPKPGSGQQFINFEGISTYGQVLEDPFQSNHGFHDAPVDIGVYNITPSPRLSRDFVAPSQTTFLSAFDMGTPIQQQRAIDFHLQYDSTASDYVTDYSLGVTPANSFDSSNSPFSRTSTPSNTRCRQYTCHSVTFESLQTSAMLQSIQAEEKSYKKPLLSRQASRRVKKSTRYPDIPSDIHVEEESTNFCEWLGCTKKFKRPEHLKRHQRCHTGEKPFICELCRKPFSRTDNLYSHVKIHLHQTSRTNEHPEAAACLARLKESSSRRCGKDEVIGSKVAKTSNRRTVVPSNRSLRRSLAGSTVC